MFHNGMDPYATVGAVLHVSYRSCKPIIVTDFKMFYVSREIYVGNNVSISYDIFYTGLMRTLLMHDYSYLLMSQMRIYVLYISTPINLCISPITSSSSLAA